MNDEQHKADLANACRYAGYIVPGAIRFVRGPNCSTADLIRHMAEQYEALLKRYEDYVRSNAPTYRLAVNDAAGVTRP